MLTEKSITEFGERAVTIAMQSFARYCQAHGVQVADLDRAVSILKQTVSAAIPQALADAKEAFEAGMGAAASQTFSASMSLAGIEAAKESAGHQ
jgi:hypothetical protein